MAIIDELFSYAFKFFLFLLGFRAHVEGSFLQSFGRVHFMRNWVVALEI